MLTINLRIKLIRNAHRMSRKEFADALKVHLQTVQTWEQDGNDLMSSNVIKICKTFNVSPFYLLFGEGVMFNER